MSEAVRPVESMTLKRPLNITRLQHWGQLSCQSQKIGKKTCNVYTHTPSLLHIHTARLPADAFHCFLFPFFLGCKMQMRRVSRLCTVSGETASQIQTSV